MEEDIPEQPLFAKFEKREQFLTLLHSILCLDLDVDPNLDEDRSEVSLLRQMFDIVNDYQEQSYLLDPFLEQLVDPAVEKLKTHAKSLVADPSRSISLNRLDRVCHLLYHFIKFRGYKTIIRFFPHEIADLSIVVDYLLIPNGPAQKASQWPLRYILLLWLSLICMIPFDLVQFDEEGNAGTTADTIETIAKTYLGRAGLERESAALTLSRLYTRKDTSSKLPGFLNWSNEIIQGSPDLFLTVGLLQTLCEVTKSGPPELIQSHLPLILDVARSIDQVAFLCDNSVLRKLKTKIIARAALRMLPARTKSPRRKGRAILHSDTTEVQELDFSDDIDVPEESEAALEELFRALQDKHTVVRWSAAKGIARISDRLPSDFVEQVLDTIMGLFSIHSVAVATIYEMPSIAENTWHGACLACAEMARRGLVADSQLSVLLDWLSKAMNFDIRKGSHSVGSSVRDAAAYVLWSLARAQDPSSLVPHALNLARRLVSVSLFDREVHIRRAASAAYQEYVGRTSLIPDGIDVLRKTDFYAVGVRRSSFLIAAPQVAEHEHYRSFLIDQLLNITLRHWDPAMRNLGAQSLRMISEVELQVLGPEIAKRAAQLLRMPDSSDIHGGLIALTELAGVFHGSNHLEQNRQEIFKYLSILPFSVIQAPRNDILLTAACYLIANSISLAEIQLEKKSSVPYWRQIIDTGLKQRNIAVQEAAAHALQAVSKFGLPTMQQSLGRLLGLLDYDAYPHGLESALEYLLQSVDPLSSAFITNVEARRNCYESVPLVLSTVSPRLNKHLTPETVCQLLAALLSGLTDYTMDERGDVGSWIRMACIQGLASFIEIIFSLSGNLPNLAIYLPVEKFHSAIGGILKQGVERLDNVRHLAGQQLLRILSLPPPATDHPEDWTAHGDDLKSLLFSEEKPVEWSEAGWLFPKAVHLLEIPEYRSSVLTGLVLSVGSKTDSTHRPVSASMVDFARRLPVSGPPYDSQCLLGDLLEMFKQNLSKNNMVIPVLQTFNILLEADVFEKVSDDPISLKRLSDLISLSTRGISKIKNVQRIQSSMKIVVDLLIFPSLFESCLNKLGEFLTHPYPTIRTDTAEYLYLVMQSRDLGRETDEAEEVLLETEWSSTSNDRIQFEASQRLIRLLSK